MITCGVDPSRANLAVSVLNDGEEVDYFEVINDNRGHRAFLKRVKKHDAQPIVCIEGHGDFAKRFAMFLSKHSIKLYEINPLKANKFKEGFSNEKTDHIDAFTAGYMVFMNSDMDTLVLKDTFEGLKKLTREHDKITKEITRVKNRYHAYMHASFGPLYKKIFKDLNKTSLNLFKHYPTPELMKKAHTTDLKKCIRAAGSRYYAGKKCDEKVKTIKKILKDYKQDSDLFTEVTASLIRQLSELLIVLLKAKKNLKKKIEKYLQKHFPEYIGCFGDELDCVKVVSLGNLLAEIGDILNFKTDKHLASYAGQAPKNAQSSGKRWRKRSKNYNRYLAKAIHMIALNNSKKGKPFHEYYLKKKKRYSKKLRALKSVKRIVCKIIHQSFTKVREKQIRRLERDIA